jgi:hypothetical protein
MQEKHPLRKFQAPGSDDDHFSAEGYIAGIKKAYPSLAAIWGEAMQEQSLHQIIQTADGKFVDKMSDEIGKALNDTMTSYVPEDAKIKAPTLGIYAISNGRYFISDEWMTEEQKTQVKDYFETVGDPWVTENIEQFQRNVPHAQVMVLPEGHHYCFIKKEKEVYDEMSKFLFG